MDESETEMPMGSSDSHRNPEVKDDGTRYPPPLRDAQFWPENPSLLLAVGLWLAISMGKLH